MVVWKNEQNLKTIDLNCDMGESYGAWKMGADAEVMPFISSANIACGFHAGDPATIRKTVRIAVDRGVAIGVGGPGRPTPTTCRSRSGHMLRWRHSSRFRAGSGIS